MSTQVLVWLGSVMVVLLAAAVLGVVVWGACWLVAWAWNWWPFRGGVGDDYTDGDGGDAELGLPPERTWEQLTSHQLPVADSYEQGFTDGAVFVNQQWSMNPPNMIPTHLSAARERRAPWWEVQQRAAYESLDLEYPSGLLARVREAGQ